MVLDDVSWLSESNDVGNVMMESMHQELRGHDAVTKSPEFTVFSHTTQGLKLTWALDGHSFVNLHFYFLCQFLVGFGSDFWWINITVYTL